MEMQHRVLLDLSLFLLFGRHIVTGAFRNKSISAIVIVIVIETDED